MRLDFQAYFFLSFSVSCFHCSAIIGGVVIIVDSKLYGSVENTEVMYMKLKVQPQSKKKKKNE